MATTASSSSAPITLSTGCFFGYDGDCGVSIARRDGRPVAHRYPRLNPGPWFKEAAEDDFIARYQAEVLAPLDPARVVADLTALAGPAPVLLCWEGTERFCHRHLVAQWLRERLNIPVREIGEHSRLALNGHLVPDHLVAPTPKTPPMGAEVVAPARPSRPPVPEFRGDFHFLSNFHAARVVLDGVVYPTLEHAFQAAKVLDDMPRHADATDEELKESWRWRILNAPTPGIAKSMGKKVPLRENWDKMKLAVMYQLLRSKFITGPDAKEMGAKLLDTGDAILIEGNTWGDTFFGVYLGKGHNYLGKLLMRVRDELAGLVAPLNPAPTRQLDRGTVIDAPFSPSPA